MSYADKIFVETCKDILANAFPTRICMCVHDGKTARPRIPSKNSAS